MTIFPRPSEWARSGTRHAIATPFAGGEQHYFAFLSYSHRDAATAKWLHDSLENFRVPHHLVGRITEHGAVPRRLTPIFRDLGELPASDDLGHEIKSALAASRFLVVLCSPAAANSKWTNAEIEAFKRARPDGCVFAAIVEGEPFASDIPGREQEECLPRALRYKYDRRGRPTPKRAEPLAADLREPGETRRLGFLKLVAGMLGVGLDDLVQREAVRRHQRMAIITGASLAGMLVAVGLTVAALDARDAARDQRREAESLIGFMLGDLKEKLEPLGRLEVLDSVGVRALQYYEAQDESSLSDEGLAQRSKALTLMGEIAQTRGDLVTASRLYDAAYAATAEAVRRDPDNPEGLFNHAQNLFWIGYIAWQRGELARAERAFRLYKQLAERMIAAEPLEPKYRLEGKYADTNLGIVLLEQRRFNEAAGAFQQSLAGVEALAASEPGNADYQKALLEGLAWLADARVAEGRLEEALAQRERQLRIIQQLIDTNPGDKEYPRKAVTAHQRLSELLAARGNLRAALDHARQAVSYADTLLRTEPGNTEWLENATVSHLNLASLLRLSGDRDGAGTAVTAGCDAAHRLAAKDRSVRLWNEDLKLNCLTQRSRLALARGTGAEALLLARQALALAETSRGKTPADAAIHRARAYLLVGQALAATGQVEAARRTWRQSAMAWPRAPLEPKYLALQRESLRLAGDREGAARLAARLETIGYTNPEFAREQ